MSPTDSGTAQDICIDIMSFNLHVNNVTGLSSIIYTERDRLREIKTTPGIS